MKLSMLWRRITATRYTRTLEAEVARLRAENRALLNSILGIAGVPPIQVAASELKCDAAAAASGTEDAPCGPQPTRQALTSAATDDTAPAVEARANGNRSGKAARLRKPNGVQVAPIRRRSWHQINRMLEFESARKKPQEVNAEP